MKCKYRTGEGWFRSGSEGKGECRKKYHKVPRQEFRRRRFEHDLRNGNLSFSRKTLTLHMNQLVCLHLHQGRTSKHPSLLNWSHMKTQYIISIQAPQLLKHVNMEIRLTENCLCILNPWRLSTRHPVIGSASQERWANFLITGLRCPSHQVTMIILTIMENFPLNWAI